jgi:WD40 repeat protein
MSTIKISNSKLDSFYNQNPNFDILQYNLCDETALSQLNWQNLDRPALVELLKKYQRLLRLNPNPEIAKKLLNPSPDNSGRLRATPGDTINNGGLDSAHAIAAIPETEFIQNYSASVGGEASTRQLYQKATAVKANTTLLWANVQNMVAAPHFRAMQANNIADSIHQSFKLLSIGITVLISMSGTEFSYQAKAVSLEASNQIGTPTTTIGSNTNNHSDSTKNIQLISQKQTLTAQSSNQIQQEGAFEAQYESSFLPTFNVWYPGITLGTNPKNQRKYVAGVQPNNTIVIWEVRTDSKTNQLSTGSSKVLNGNIKPTERIRALSMSPDTKLLAAAVNANDVSNGKDNRILIWNVQTGKIVAQLFGPSDVNTTYSLTSLAFSINNQFLVSGHGEHKNSKAIVWKLNQVLPKAQKNGGTARLQNLINNNDYYALDADSISIASLNFSPNGKLLATSGSEKKLKLWDASTWNAKPITTIDIPTSRFGGQALAFSSDSQLLAAAIEKGIKGGGEIHLWNIRDPKKPQLLKEFTGFTGAARSVAFSPDNQRLIAGSSDGTIKLWNLGTNKEIMSQDLRPSDRTPAINSVAFVSNSNQSFLTATTYGNISQWSLAQKPPTPPEPSNSVNIIAGVLLILYAPLALYLIDASRKKLATLIHRSLKTINNLVCDGEALDDSIANSAKIIDRCSQKVKEIADDLEAGKPQAIAFHYQENPSVNIEYDIKPTIEDVRSTSDNIYKLKEQTEDLSEKTKKMFGDLKSKLPHDKQILNIVNPLYLSLILFHIGLLLLGIWLLILGVQGIQADRGKLNASINYSSLISKKDSSAD